MKGLTNTTLWEFLVFLQEKAKYNVLEVKQNLDKIKDYSDNFISQNIESKDLIHRLMRKNEEIRKENSMLLMVHSFILQINEQESWCDTETEETNATEVTIENYSEEQYSKSKCVQKILNGEVDLNSNDVCFEDEDILNTVYEEFLQSERYEDCEIIKNKKRRIRKSKNSSQFSQGIFFRFLKLPFFRALKKNK
jgi:hypothetical protein